MWHGGSWHVDIFSDKMGGGNSKQNAVETSNGFHFVEIHAHTMGISIITVIVVLIIVALAHSCASRLCKKYLRRPQHDHNNVLPIHHQPFQPIFYPEPYQHYLGMAMANRSAPTASIYELPPTIAAAPPNRRRQPRLPTVADASANSTGGASARKQESAACAAANEWPADTV